MRYQAALRPDASIVAQRRLLPDRLEVAATPPHLLVQALQSRADTADRVALRAGESGERGCYNQSWYGGYSSAAERLTVAQDVVGSIPTSRPRSAWWIAYATPLQ
jgi:hypothetical protein